MKKDVSFEWNPILTPGRVHPLNEESLNKTKPRILIDSFFRGFVLFGRERI